MWREMHYEDCGEDDISNSKQAILAAGAGLWMPKGTHYVFVILTTVFSTTKEKF
jgi:hypothetical protein